ncbi:MAG: DUF6580 family putative transport protein [Candidatus Azotimanducaceae bacterium WSBS_2022_MAG_OTU7]
MRKTVLVTCLLSFLGVITHLLPHAYGFTTIGAVSLLAAAYLPKSFIPIPVIISVLIADIFVGGYAFNSMLVVYFAHLAAALSIFPLCRGRKFAGLAGAGVVNAIVFYLISNLSPMLSGYYPATGGGLLLCYLNGLPFLLKGILANMVFGGIAFGAIYLVTSNRRLRLLFQTQ